MNKPGFMRGFAAVALAAVVMLAAAVPSQAEGPAGHGFIGGHPGAGHRVFGRHGGVVEHRGFSGHHRGQRFFGQHHLHRGPHSVFIFGGTYPFYSPPAYAAPTPAYWYYCPSYDAYYPDVMSCPEAWVPVPAS